MESFYAFALMFASEHWFLTWCALWLFWAAYWLAGALLFRLPVRILRAIVVLLRGWPPAHLDADGDWKPAPKEASK
jgi:hypothetical protein